MSGLDDRAKNFENKYKHDEELAFRVQARRNKLFGLWAADLLGLKGADAENYAKQIVQINLTAPGDDDIIQKVLGDFAQEGVKDQSEHRLVRHLEEFMEAAKTQISSE